MQSIYIINYFKLHNINLYLQSNQKHKSTLTESK